jgi:opacity protein-like surface antigen
MRGLQSFNCYFLTVDIADSTGAIPSAKASPKAPRTTGPQSRHPENFMRACNLSILSILCASTFLVLGVTVQAQQNPPDSPSAQSVQTQGNDRMVEGTVISTTRHTLVIRSDDSQYHLFTYAAGVVPKGTVKPGVRVRVNGSTPDAQGTRVATSVSVIQPGAQAASTEAGPPAQMTKLSKDIESQARRWHVGGKIGMGLSPELLMFGPQVQLGLTPHLLFRPNVEFGFGELTDMYAVNGEAAYRLGTTFHGQWSPYLGMGPSFNFIHQSASSGDVSFSDFEYKTGFNIFVGAQKNRTFVEVKTALWSDKAPVFRVFVGYNF